jgi:hypothetical protein
MLRCEELVNRFGEEFHPGSDGNEGGRRYAEIGKPTTPKARAPATREAARCANG